MRMDAVQFLEGGAMYKAAPELWSLQLEEIQRILLFKHDDWGVLQLTDPSSQKEINKSYKRLALILHPDKNKHEGATEAFKVIAQAYTELTKHLEDNTGESSDEDPYANLETYQKPANHPDGDTARYKGVSTSEKSPEDVFKSFFPSGYPSDSLSNPEVLLELAGKLGPEWYSLGAHLQIEPNFLEGLIGSGARHALPLRMLQTWKQRWSSQTDDAQHAKQLIQAIHGTQLYSRRKEKIFKCINSNKAFLSRAFPLIYKELHSCWKKVGISLGLEECDLEELDITHEPDDDKAKFKMLLHWKQNTTDESVILQALQQIGREDMATWLESRCGIVSIKSTESQKVLMELLSLVEEYDTTIRTKADGMRVEPASKPELGSIPFIVPDGVVWGQFAAALDNKLVSLCGVGLTKDHRHFLATKLFGPGEDFTNHPVKWSKINQEPLPGHDFTFWEWFYGIVKLIKDWLTALWMERHIHGFISKDEAQDCLSQCSPGTFLLRFSDSVIGGITVAWVKEDNPGERCVFHLAPFTDEDFKMRGLADRLKDIDLLTTLYPNIPKHDAFKTFWTQETFITPGGYVGYRNKTAIFEQALESMTPDTHDLGSISDEDLWK